MITGISLNAASLSRITGKIATLQANLAATDKIYYTIEHYAKAYRNGVIKVMGTVQAADMEGGPVGAYPTISFLDLSDSTEWAPLSHRAIDSKIKNGNGRITFWYETGDAFHAVGHSVQVGSYHSDRVVQVFAGIDKSTDPEAYEHAIRAEFGADGQFARRALFTIANELFKQKQDEIINAVKQVVLAGVDWGR